MKDMTDRELWDELEEAKEDYTKNNENQKDYENCAEDCRVLASEARKRIRDIQEELKIRDKESMDSRIITDGNVDGDHPRGVKRYPPHEQESP